jgi:ADP-ribose pyrophosphatase YjhB (NUDIX family)
MKSRVAASAIIQKGDYFLFGRKLKDIGPYPNKWLIIGGGVNLGSETIQEALLREISEEAGIEVTDIKEVSFDEDFTKNKHGEMEHYVFLNYWVKYKSGDAKPDDDIAELKWFHKSEIPKLDLCEPSIKLFKKVGLL